MKRTPLKRKPTGEERACQHCGEMFYAQRRDINRGGGKWCSRACYYAGRDTKAGNDTRRAKLKRRRARRTPPYRHGNDAGRHDRDAERFKSGQTRCQHPTCGGASRKLDEHHVVYRQHIRAHGGDQWDSRDALLLCAACHQSHHHRGRVLPLTALRDENCEFAFELLGTAAYDYLRRYYAGEDPRLDALLEAEYPRRRAA